MTSKVVIMKGSILEQNKYENIQLNQEKIPIYPVKKFDNTMKLLPDFNSYELDI
jgi:hypothetical protein